MVRKEVKVHEDTNGVEIKYDLKLQSIVSINEKFKSKTFKKYSIDQIIYDEHVVACFYRPDEHPFVSIFNENFIKFAKMFSGYGMSVILDGIANNIANILVFPNEKVKLYKT